MDYTVSEPTALFTLPFMITLGNNAYELINELGLIFVPFWLAMIRAFVMSRAQGKDEGTAEILAIKMIESQWIPMGLIVFLAVMPITDKFSAPNFTYTAYSCAQVPSLIEGVNSVSQLRPNTAFAGHYGSHNTSGLMGTVHQASTAINGVLTANIFCGQGVNRYEVSSSLLNANTHSRPIVENIKTFDSQCYQRGLNYINNVVNNDKQTIPIPSNKDLYFNSIVMRSSYSHSLDGAIGLPTQFQKPSTWDSEMVTSSKSKLSIPCSEAANEIESTLKDELGKRGQGSFEEWSSRIKDVLNVANTSDSVSSQEAEQELLATAYINIIRNNGASPLEVQKTTVLSEAQEETRAKLSPNTYSNYGQTQNVGYKYHVQQAQETLENNEVVNQMVYLGGIWGDMVKAIETMTYIRMAPSLVSVIQGFMMASLPLIMLLSGYSAKVLMMYFIAYFGISLVPFFINFGVMIETILTRLIISENNLIPIRNGAAEAIIDYAGTASIMFLVAGWLSMLQMLGVRVSAMLDAATDSSAKTGQRGGMMLEQSLNSTGKLSSNIGNSFGGGDPKREMDDKAQATAQRVVEKMLNKVGRSV
ncbi:hypothetical protein [Vibrio crassostreae]|uniref:hypothetical protein n=1 Tax=Vibrio crassostreae TaxID=246167 RepID=UPI001B309026|nr:hypothetical protein [Vibrio crassostreae]